MKYKALLLTSGIGSRLGNVTLYTNKVLVRVGDKPALSYIIDCYDESIEIIVVLGHFGNQVKDYLEIAYPSRNFQFVWVDNYSQPGSSLVYSLLQAKDKIDCPFIYHACDTLIFADSIPEPSKNWLGGHKSEKGTEYTSFNVIDDHVVKIFNKGEQDFDYIYVGLAGIYDYQKFFNEITNLYNQESMNSQLSDVDVSAKLVEKGIKYGYANFPSWLDIGNIDKLKEARALFTPQIEVLDKETESIYLVDNQVIKFFYDEEVVAERVARAKILKGLVPDIINVKPNFYSYKYVQGQVLSSVITEELMDQFLEWSKCNLWKRNSDGANIYQLCQKFYFEKTRKRIATFLEKYNIKDKAEIINGCAVPKIFDMLDSIPFSRLCTTESYTFHGDYILDNVLVTENGFTLLDWRQDFGGDLFAGDIYYDLAKLNHNLIFNHKIISNKNFIIELRDSTTVDLLISYNLWSCKEKYTQFLKTNNFDIEKVNLLTAIIWLNMSPLHDYPVDIFLYYFGKLNLFRVLKGKSL